MRLTALDAIVLLRAIVALQTMPTAYKDTLRLLDKDRDGKLSFEEFRGMLNAKELDLGLFTSRDDILGSSRDNFLSASRDDLLESSHDNFPEER